MAKGDIMENLKCICCGQPFAKLTHLLDHMADAHTVQDIELHLGLKNASAVPLNINKTPSEISEKHPIKPLRQQD